MFLFCILNFYVEADCLEYALDILIWSKPFDISLTYFPVLPLPSQVLLTSTIKVIQHNGLALSQLPYPIKMKANWYFCLLAFAILLSSS